MRHDLGVAHRKKDPVGSRHGDLAGRDFEAILLQSEIRERKAMPCSRRSLMRIAASAGLLSVAGGPLFAEPTAIYAEGGVAVDGTDVVAYFTEGRPVPGDPAFAHRWAGVDWHFSSAANRDTFAADPEAYAPQYGGFCAWAVADGYTASTTPDAWAIVDGKLYLNYSNRIQRRWERDVPGFIAAADANWPTILD